MTTPFRQLFAAVAPRFCRLPGWWLGSATARTLAVVTAVVGAALLAGPAVAQTAATGNPGYRPTQGLGIPGGALAGDSDASAVELNPGQLGLLEGSSLMLIGKLAATDAPLPGRGAGLLLGTPLVFQSIVGLGLQTVADSRGLGIVGHTKLSLSYATRLGRTLALGVGWAHIFKGSYDGLDTFDAGLSWRPARGLALGLVVRDLTAPRHQMLPALARSWALEAALRPLATDRLELGLAAGILERSDWQGLSTRVRLALRLTQTLRLFADFESLPGQADHVFADGSDYRGSVGFWFDLDHLGAGFAVGSARPGVGQSGSGGTLLVRVSSDRYPTSIAGERIERVSLEGVDSERGYLNLVRRLRAVAGAEGVVGVLLRIENVELGWGRVEEVRDLVAAIRARGKAVFAYVTFPSTREYYLASACNAVIAHPAGELSLRGLGQAVTFYKGLMDRVGVNVDLVRIAEYKGAMEPFVMTEHSPAVRDNKNSLLDDVFGRVTAAIVAGRGGPARGLSEEKLRAIIDRGSLTPSEAQGAGLVDAIKDDSELDETLRKLTGRPRLAVVDPDPAPLRPQSWGGRRVAVVLVEGAIADGPSQTFPLGMGEVAGSDTLVAALEECRRDPGIGAVVLRVNSPGGSAFASDVIARSIQQVRKAGKPVIVSMGDVAASGGYYIAAPADAIFAQPSTTTGSIGIFAYKADVRKLALTMGVSVETFRRGQYADFFSPYRPWTPDELKLAGDRIKHFYGLFLETVAQGRKARGITVAKADELGRGHIWTGAQAHGLGLVDTLGGLAAAIDQASRMGRIPVVRGGFAELTVLPRPRQSSLEKLVGLGITGGADQPNPVSAASDAVAEEPGARLVRQLGRGPLRLLLPLLSGNGSGVEARMPFDIEIY